MAHQEQDPKNLLIVAIGLGSVVTLTGVMFGLYSYYQNLRDDWQHVRIAEKANPELVAMRSENSRVLTSYAYTDASRKNVRIPVGDAMTLLAQRGRDAFPSIQPASGYSLRAQRCDPSSQRPSALSRVACTSARIRCTALSTRDAGRPWRRSPAAREV